MKNSKFGATVLALVLIFWCGASALAQADDELSAADKAKQKMEKILQDATPIKAKTPVPGKAANTDPARPQPLPAGVTDPETLRLFEKALQDYYAYRSQGLDHRTAVFEWQLFSAKMIFMIVVFLVVCGIVFAGIQFRMGLLQSAAKGQGAAELVTEIELSSGGVKLSSPVLGVIILFLSLAFFYLYLVYVYTIENVF